MQNQIRYVVAIASGKGGVGKSTVTVNLAHALAAQGLGVGILDADIYGPSQRRMLGVAEDVMPEQEDGKWLHPIEAQGLKAMKAGTMDPSGRSATRSGVVCGIVGCCIGLLYTAVMVYGLVIDPSFFEVDP